MKISSHATGRDLLNRILISNYHYFFILFFVCLPLRAQWSQDSTENLKISSRYGGVNMVSDGTGGAIVFINGAGNYIDLYAMKVDHEGYLPWGTEEVDICRAPLAQQLRGFSSDGLGGAYVGWIDYRRSDLIFIYDSSEVYVQRIDSSGIVHFETDGMNLRSSSYGLVDMFGGEMVSDVAGGVIIHTSLNNSIYNHNDIYLHRIDETGNRLWGESGAPVDTGSSVLNIREFSDLVSDGLGGAIVGIIGYLNWNSFYYFIRIDNFGQKLWTSDTIWYDGGSWQNNMVEDQEGGAYFFFQNKPDTSASIRDCYVNRIDSEGNFLWGENGIRITDSSIHSKNVRDIITTPEGDLLIALSVNIGEHPNNDYNLYSLKLSPEGEFLWDSSGVIICDTLGNQWDIHILPSEDNGMYAVWCDIRNNDSTGVDIYCQRLNGAGESVWAQNGVAASLKSWGSQANPVFVSDGTDGIIIAWYEIATETGSGTYVQQINGVGELGEPTPLGIKEDVHFPKLISLANYPNPFNFTTTIYYELSYSGIVSGTIYDVAGREIIRLFNEQKQKGFHRIKWDGLDMNSISVASGVYFIELKYKDISVKHKIMLLK